NELYGYVLWKPSRDFTRALGPPSGLKGMLHTLNATVVDAHGVVLALFFATGRHFKLGLFRCHAKDDDGIFVIMDVSRRSRLEAWLRACCLLEGKKKSSGGIFDDIKI
ncbi:hypothetical protein Tco_0849149, partial [Tanacetum coccineum]